MINYDNFPIFTTIDLVPKKLNLTIREWHQMPLSRFKVLIEELRQYIINSVLGAKHNFFSGNLTLEEIIILLKKIDKNERKKYFIYKLFCE